MSIVSSFHNNNTTLLSSQIKQIYIIFRTVYTVNATMKHYKTVRYGMAPHGTVQYGTAWI